MVRYWRAWAAAGTAAATLLLGAACSGSGGSDHGDDDAFARSAPAAESGAFSNSVCLTCHSRPGLLAGSADGDEHLLQAVTPFGFYTSVHGEVSCTECHRDQSELPHRRITAAGKPAVSAADDPSAVCRSCHGGAAERFMDSVHGTSIRLGDERAPGCTDCHSAHYVRPMDSWVASAKAEACRQCHEGADATFAAALTHREVSPERLAIDYYATRFFGALVVAVVGIGILHVEFDMLRWTKDKISRRSRKDRGR